MTKTLTKLVGLSLLAVAGISSQATSLDLTAGGSGQINNAIFTTTQHQSTGTGVIDSFVRVQNNGTAEGYNSSLRPVMPDVNTSPIFTHDLKLSAVPILTIDSKDYYEFLLDINQTKANPFLSLDAVDIYTRSTPLAGADDLSDLTGAGSSLRYSLDLGGDSEVLLNYSNNNGSGSGDMFAYIPVSLFGAETDDVYLYSHFGGKADVGTGKDKVTYSENDGFEEWAVRERTNPPTVPDGGATVALLGVGLLGLGAMRRKVS